MTKYRKDINFVIVGSFLQGIQFTRNNGEKDKFKYSLNKFTECLIIPKKDKQWSYIRPWLLLSRCQAKNVYKGC